MNSVEVTKLLAYLQVAYPNSKITPDIPTVRLWTKHLADIPSEIAQEIADAMIDTSPYPPNISNFREAYAKAISEARGDQTAGEAWSEVLRIIHRYGSWEPTKARADLGERLWGAIAQAGGWEQVCLGDPQVVSAQFERRYNDTLKREQYLRQVPASIQGGLKKLLSGMSMTKLLGDGSEDNSE